MPHALAISSMGGSAASCAMSRPDFIRESILPVGFVGAWTAGRYAASPEDSKPGRARPGTRGHERPRMPHTEPVAISEPIRSNLSPTRLLAINDGIRSERADSLATEEP